MPLPLIPVAAGALALGGGQAVGNLIAGAKQRKETKRRIAELEGLKAAGRLGELSPAEEAAFQRERDALARAASQASNDFARISGVQGASGADIAQARRDELQARAAGAQAVSDAERQRTGQKESAQLNELQHLNAARTDQSYYAVKGIADPLTQAAEMTGRLAGAEPEVLNLAGLFGQKLRALPPEDRKQLRQFFKTANDEQIQAVIAALGG